MPPTQSLAVGARRRRWKHPLNDIEHLEALANVEVVSAFSAPPVANTDKAFAKTARVAMRPRQMVCAHEH